MPQKCSIKEVSRKTNEKLKALQLLNEFYSSKREINA
jgi:hypothetical protein